MLIGSLAVQEFSGYKIHNLRCTVSQLGWNELFQWKTLRSNVSRLLCLARVMRFATISLKRSH